MKRLKGISAHFFGIAYPALTPRYQKEGIQDSNHNLQIALNGMAPSYICDLLQVCHPPAYERGGDAHRKFWIKPLKETDLSVAQVFFYP